MAGLLALGVRLGAQEAAFTDHQVQAACLVNFPSFIDWPVAMTNAATNETFTIGILGKDPFGASFDQAITNVVVKGRSVRLQRGNDLAELEGCPLIFIGFSEPKRLGEVLRKLEGTPVLTVAAESGFARRGTMINFIKIEEDGVIKVRFEFNVLAAEQVGIKISPKLLQLGKIILPGRSAANK